MQVMKRCLMIMLFVIIAKLLTAQVLPAIDVDFPDPTVILANGQYYAYGTNTSRNNSVVNVQVAVSTNLQEWKLLDDAMPQKPLWASSDFWAPHVIYNDELQQYVLFFSARTKDSTKGMGFGVAFSNNPEGPFIAEPQPLLKDTGFVAIDPMVIKDPKTKKYFITWGSGFQPIKIRELHMSMTQFEKGSSEVAIIPVGKDKLYSKLVEGPWIDYHEGFYYLYYSGDNCCGAKANYAVLVARAKNILGPYMRLGEWNNTQNSAILEKDANIVAPGHNSIIRDLTGAKWIAYHGIPVERFTKGKYARFMYLTRIEYKNGWPVVMKKHN